METELSREQIHRELYEMLCKFADYCEAHKLRYYLVGGTLLGAVRHQGFIPWDDDIDVGMPRPDYEKFLDLVKNNPIADNLVVRSNRLDNFVLPYAELHNDDIRLERRTSEFIDEDYQVLHLFLDIIPQDGFPESKMKTRFLLAEMAFLRKLSSHSRSKLFHGTNPIRALLKTPTVLIGRLITNKRIIDFMDNTARKRPFDKSKYVGGVTFGLYGFGERCLREEYTADRFVTFEGQQFRAPGCVESYLAAIYGADYMQLPPESKRKDHGLRAWRVVK